MLGPCLNIWGFGSPAAPCAPIPSRQTSLALAALATLVIEGCSAPNPDVKIPAPICPETKTSSAAISSSPVASAKPVSPSALPSDTERLVATMAKVRIASWPSFSPDGKRIAFVSDLSGVPQVWVIPTSGGFPQLVTNLDDPVRGASWSPDGQWIAFAVAPGGGMNQQIYVVRPDGTGMRRLTDGGKDNNYLGDWTYDSKSIHFASNRKNPNSTDSFVIDVASGEITLVAESRGSGSVDSIKRDNSAAIVSRSAQRGNSDLFYIRSSDKKEWNLTPHEGPGTFWGGTFTPDGKTIYLASNKDRDLLALAKISIGKDETPGPIEVVAARDDAELDALAMNDAGTLMALAWNVGGKSELGFFDLKTGKTTAGPALPAEITNSLRFSKDGKQLVMVINGATSPPDVWTLDLKSKDFKRITQSPHAGIDLASLVRPEKIAYKATDGVDLSGWLYRPKGSSGPTPIVLSFHGGPEGQERPTFNSTYQALLARGIGVFAPNVRGSAGFGKKFVNLDNGSLRENAVKDIEATAKYVISSGVGDPKRIGIMGGSYGGYMTMAGLTQYPELFAAGVNSYGVVNFLTFFKHSEAYIAAISKIEYGDPDKESTMLEKISPFFKLDRVKAPTLVLHGANDTNVPVVEATQVVETLTKRGVPVEFVLFPDEGHGWRKTPNKVKAAVSIVTFLEKYLLGK
jgi:dipeptidyl aminopeptidase/acylaminoacyl peptidase